MENWLLHVMETFSFWSRPEISMQFIKKMLLWAAIQTNHRSNRSLSKSSENEGLGINPKSFGVWGEVKPPGSAQFRPQFLANTSGRCPGLETEIVAWVQKSVTVSGIGPELPPPLPVTPNRKSHRANLTEDPSHAAISSEREGGDRNMDRHFTGLHTTFHRTVLPSSDGLDHKIIIS